jgi:hypothetical protein
MAYPFCCKFQNNKANFVPLNLVDFNSMTCVIFQFFYGQYLSLGSDSPSIAGGTFPGIIHPRASRDE